MTRGGVRDKKKTEGGFGGFRGRRGGGAADVGKGEETGTLEEQRCARSEVRKEPGPIRSRQARRD